MASAGPRMTCSNVGHFMAGDAQGKGQRSGQRERSTERGSESVWTPPLQDGTEGFHDDTDWTLAWVELHLTLDGRINVHIVQMVRWMVGGVSVHSISKLIVTEGHIHISRLLYEKCLGFHLSASTILKFLRCFVPFCVHRLGFSKILSFCELRH